MKKEKKKVYQRYMLRPIVYMTAFRLILSAIFIMIIVRFVKNPLGPTYASSFLAVLFLLGAFLVYLRSDGLGIPRMKYIRPKKKKDPVRNYGDMQDYIDEETVSFDELEDDEKDLVSLIASVINAGIFLILSFIV